jgi:hypothetical protein
MHNVVLVIGDHPVEQLRPLHPDPFDWYAVGGRYSGWLLTRPEATTGILYGDAISAAEARVLDGGRGTLERKLALRGVLAGQLGCGCGRDAASAGA